MTLWPACKNGSVQATTGSEVPFDDAPDGPGGFDDVLEHFVDGIFIENAQIAIGEQVHFQGLELDAILARLVLNGNDAEVGQAGLGANRRVFGKSSGDDVARKLVGPGFQGRKFSVDSSYGMFIGVIGHRRLLRARLLRRRYNIIIVLETGGADTLARPRVLPYDSVNLSLPEPGR